MGNVSVDRSQSLLYYLAVTGRLHNWEKSASLLWGDRSEDGAEANLRKSLSNLRQLLGVALSSTRQTIVYRLDVEVSVSVLVGDDPAAKNLQR
jgi:DNA-binding SARP family transcriptional activator